MLGGTIKDVVATIRETNEGIFNYDIGRDMSAGARFDPAEQGSAAVRVGDAQVRSPALVGNSVEVNVDQKSDANKSANPRAKYQAARLPSRQAPARNSNPDGRSASTFPTARCGTD